MPGPVLAGDRRASRASARRARGRSPGRGRSRRRAGGAAALEALEDPVALGRVHARPVVGDLDLGAARPSQPAVTVDRLAGRAVAERVVDEDPHDAGDRVRVAAAPARAVGRHDVERDAALLRPRARTRRRPRAPARPSSTASERSGTDASRRLRSSSSPARLESRSSSRRAPATCRLRVGECPRGRRAGPPRAAPSCPGASSAGCAARARRWPRTSAGRPPAGAAPPACARTRARGRRPRRGRRRAAGGASTTPSWLIRTAAPRRRPRRRSSVLESATASAIATSSPTAAGRQQRVAELLDRGGDLGQPPLDDEHADDPVVAEQPHADAHDVAAHVGRRRARALRVQGHERGAAWSTRRCSCRR